MIRFACCHDLDAVIDQPEGVIMGRQTAATLAAGGIVTTIRHVKQDRLRSAIFRIGKTQRLIARRARVDETRLSAIIHGRALPTEIEKKRLAKAVHQPVHELFAQSA